MTNNVRMCVCMHVNLNRSGLNALPNFSEIIFLSRLNKFFNILCVCVCVCFIALQAKGWDSSKDIGSPPYRSPRFTARLRLAKRIRTKPNLVRHTSNHLPPRDHNQVLLREGGMWCGDSASAALQFR